MTEVPLPDGRSWIVRAHAFSDGEEARREWERLFTPGDNFSVWRTMNPNDGTWAVIVCGLREDLPTIQGGQPIELTMGEAETFCLRRARLALDAIEAGTTGHVTQVGRYGKSGGRIIDGGGRLRRPT